MTHTALMLGSKAAIGGLHVLLYFSGRIGNLERPRFYEATLTETGIVAPRPADGGHQTDIRIRNIKWKWIGAADRVGQTRALLASDGDRLRGAIANDSPVELSFAVGATHSGTLSGRTFGAARPDSFDRPVGEVIEWN